MTALKSFEIRHVLPLGSPRRTASYTIRGVHRGWRVASRVSTPIEALLGWVRVAPGRKERRWWNLVRNVMRNEGSRSWSQEGWRPHTTKTHSMSSDKGRDMDEEQGQALDSGRNYTLRINRPHLDHVMPRFCRIFIVYGKPA